MILRVGAPCYRMQLRAEHAQMLVHLAAQHGDRHPIEAIDYTHTSVLPAGRASVLTRAVETSEAHALLSVDSDTWVDGNVLARVLDEAQALFGRHGDVAQLGVCVPQDDRRVNAWSALGQRLEKPKPWTPIPVWAIGAAIVVHNLEWHRWVAKRHKGWPNESYAVFPTAPGVWMGEDVVHCVQIHEREGRVFALYTGGGVFHAAFGT